MRVLLVQSYIDGDEPPVYPIGLSCLIPHLEEHDVLTFDSNISSSPFKEFEEILVRFKPEAVGISLRNIDSPSGSIIVSYLDSFKRLCKQVKEKSEAVLIVGGAGFSLFAQQVMEDESSIDLGVFLEGEKTFADLLNNLDSPEEVPSVYYREGTKIVFSGKGTVPQNLCTPDMNAFPIESYAEIICPEGVGIETKRGCALGCAYCPYGFLNGKEYRLKNPEQVAHEILNLASRGIKRFTFVDSVFNIPRNHAEDVCRALIDGGNTIPWSAWFNERELDKDFVNLVQKAGCNNMILSPDGFSEGILKKLGKNIAVDDILRTYGLLEELKFPKVSYSFFRNPPGQTYGAFIRLFLFCLKAKFKMGRRVSFYFSRLRIEPHSEICELAKSEGLIRSEQDLLKPVFYSNQSTSCIEYFFDFVLWLKGGQ